MKSSEIKIVDDLFDSQTVCELIVIVKLRG